MIRSCSTFLSVASLVLLAGPTAAAEPAPSYQRQVTALLSRLGCNGGTCHGAVKGQNGFRLSLFGADPDHDHAHLLRDFAGRRIVPHDPDASLLLSKATDRAPHQGGRRLDPGGYEYAVLRQWIAAGAPIDPREPSRLRSLRIQPAEHVVRPGEAYSLAVEATFADGSTLDVTRYCSFSSRDAHVAAVDGAGRVTARGVGEAALIVRYRDQPGSALVMVPRQGEPFARAEPPANVIDAHVQDKLRRLNLPTAPLADDATYLRRVTLDVAGRLPTPAEVRAFLSDSAPFKRQRKVDELLASPDHAALWTLWFCDLLKASDFGVYADALTLEGDAPRFQAWVRARLDQNLPYDEFAARILLATSREGREIEPFAAEVRALLEGQGPGRPDLDVYRARRTLDLYWQRRGADGVSGAMQVAHAFLGLRLECAQCHRHPHDVWQQDDLLSFANFFMRVRKVGFEGDNEKKYPELAALDRKLQAEAKKLEEALKKRRADESKGVEEEGRKAKADAERLAAELARLEKDGQAGLEALAAMRAELAARREAARKPELWREELARLERQAKALPEVGRRLLHAEVRLLPAGKPASVTSTLGTQKSDDFRLLGQHASAGSVPPERDPREAVVAWLRRPDNPYFARALVNRVWSHYFGRGLIDPPDNLSAFNPATHPELLRDLADGFVRSGYDLRWLHRTILASRTYQRAGAVSREMAADGASYSHFRLRRLPAEVLVDAVDDATGTTEKFDLPHLQKLDDGRAVALPYAPRNPYVVFLLDHFGKPRRNAAVQCDCERDSSVSVFQVLTLANHPRVAHKIASQGGRVDRLTRESGPEADKVEELFLATLSRYPDDRERAACREYLRGSASPAAGLQGILWGLLNTREFLLQH